MWWVWLWEIGGKEEEKGRKEERKQCEEYGGSGSLGSEERRMKSEE